MFRMMVVDDNPNDRRGITELIDWGGLDIEIVGTAMNGELGFRKALELKPDFVLTDVAMPRMNGIKMTEKIREELPETRFIYMSCFDDVAYLQGKCDIAIIGTRLLQLLEQDGLPGVSRFLAGLAR